MLKTIEVTQKDIDTDDHKAISCPIARAIWRACPNSIPHVYGRDILFENANGTDRIIHNDFVGQFVNQYDYSGPDSVQPTTFKLNIPDELCS